MDTQTRPIEIGSPLLTDEEACNYLRIRQRQLYSWRMQGVIPFIRIGRSIRYRLRDLAAAVDAMTVIPLPDAVQGNGIDGHPTSVAPSSSTHNPQLPQ
jgi:excisionase family DNA binding protein